MPNNCWPVQARSRFSRTFSAGAWHKACEPPGYSNRHEAWGGRHVAEGGNSNRGRSDVAPGGARSPETPASDPPSSAVAPQRVVFHTTACGFSHHHVSFFPIGCVSVGVILQAGGRSYLYARSGRVARSWRFETTRAFRCWPTVTASADATTRQARRPVRRDTSALVTGAAILLLAYLLFLIFRPFAVALVFAAVMAVVFHPLHAKLRTIARSRLHQRCSCVVDRAAHQS